LAQQFTMTASQPSPSSLDPGVSSLATIALSSLNGFNSAVALSCSVLPQQANGATCAIQASATPPATAALTIQTTTATPPTNYRVTVTGVGPSTTNTVTVNLTVLALTPAYTVTVTTPISPATLHAGSQATAVFTVTPTNGYTGTVTLSCAISPSATPAPVCKFDPTPVTITDNNSQNSTL